MFLTFGVLASVVCASGTTVSQRFDDIVVKFIVNATPSFFPPSRTCFYWCANDEDTLRLSTEMSKLYFTHNVRSIRNGFDGRFCDDDVQHQTLNVLDLDCAYAEDVLEKANSSRLFVGPKKWLIFHDEMKFYAGSGIKDMDTFVVKTFGKLAIYPDSDVLLAGRLENDFFRLTAPYRPSPYRGIILEDRGNWTISHGVRKRNDDIASRRRRNLHLTPLRSSNAMTNPDTINHLTDYQNILVDPTPKAGYLWSLLLVDRLNATLSINVTDAWGYKDSNGSWNGMIGMLQRGEADLGGSGTFLVPQRIDVVQYINLYTYTGSRFIFKKPLLSTVSNIFILIFQRSVWIAIGSLLVLVFCLLYLSMKWEFYIGASDKSGNYWAEINANEPTVGDDFLILLGAVAQQGYAYEPYRVPSRIVTIMLLIVSLSLYAAYTANIVGLLQSTTDSINTLDDLVKSPLKLGAHDVSYYRYYFKAFQDPVRKAISKKMTASKSCWMTVPEGVQRIREGLFAFHAEVSTIYKIMQDTYQENEKCGLTEVDYLKVFSPMMVIQKQSPYLEMIKNWALLMHETGLKFRDEYRLFVDKPPCHGQISFITIGITECYFPLLTMAGGILLSNVILALELLWYRYKPAINITAQNLMEKGDAN